MIDRLIAADALIKSPHVPALSGGAGSNSIVATCCNPNIRLKDGGMRAIGGAVKSCRASTLCGFFAAQGVTEPLLGAGVLVKAVA